LGDEVLQLHSTRCHGLIIAVSETGFKFQKILPVLDRELVSNMSGDVEKRCGCFHLNRCTSCSSCYTAGDPKLPLDLLEKRGQ
jgi:hypothetical protein